MDAPRSCSIANTLEVVGERWALLVVRELLLGNSRFEQIRAATGAPRAVLTARLRTLVASGLVKTQDYRDDGARTRHEYRLTPAGHDLQPVLAALMQWGDRHRTPAEGPPIRLEHRDCGADLQPRLVCARGHTVATHADVRAVPAGPSPFNNRGRLSPDRP